MLTKNVDSREIFSALTDPLRVRILRILVSTAEDACLCEFVDSLHEPQYKISRHLKTLRQAGLLSAEKDGRWVYHRLETGVPYLRHLHATLKELPDEDKRFSRDLKNFRLRLKLRERGRCRIGIQNKEFAKGNA